MKKAAIKVKAMGLFVSDGRLLVSPGFDEVSQKPHFRLLGGGSNSGTLGRDSGARRARRGRGS